MVPQRWRAFLLLKTFASLRWGEITALTRQDLDLERRTVRVRRQFVTVPGGLDVGPPKSRAGLRIVSFPAGILPELHRHLDRFAGDGPSGLVFPNQHGRPYRRGNFNKAVGWAEVRERLGVPDLHRHDLRHAGNTFAARSGASLRDLMVRMGHDSPAAALIYQHSSRASDEAIAAALDAQLTDRLQKAENDSRDGSGAHVGPDEGQSARPEEAETR
jgi:integrase